MSLRFVRPVLAGVAALVATAASANAFGPSPGLSASNPSRHAPAPVVQVHDRWYGGRAYAAPVIVVPPRHQVGDGLCVTRQPVTSISCYRLLREQQQRQFYFQHAHEHGPGCGHTPRYGRRHNQLVFLGWY
jgi:hypothetical protein